MFGHWELPWSHHHHAPIMLGFMISKAKSRNQERAVSSSAALSRLSVHLAEVRFLPQQDGQPEPRRLHPVLGERVHHLLPRDLCPDCWGGHGAGRLALRGVGHLPQA